MTSSTPIHDKSVFGNCRFCGTRLERTFVDLGMSPLCESYVGPEAINHPETVYPLHALICEKCLLVQLDEYVSPGEIFSDYAYFSSYSDSWLAHSKRYTDLMVERFGLNARSQVMEIASNDGYLLQYFVKKGIPVLGIEPAANVAETAVGKGVPTTVRFFGVDTARALREEKTAESLGTTPDGADLLLGNNVLAHVPDINDFVAGMKILLKPDGVITMEFPHLLRLMEENQFDTIYHEHFSYLSLHVVEKIFAHHGLTLFEVEELSTHGGSLRIYARHEEDDSKPVGPRVAKLKAVEERAGLLDLATYSAFSEQVKVTKWKLLEFLIEANRSGKQVAGYGAPGKGNTLLNHCGIRTDLLSYTVDRSPHKQGKYLPGTRIPIYHPDRIRETKPDYVVILPWNLKDEIMEQMAFISEWGGRFVVPIPEVQVCDPLESKA